MSKRTSWLRSFLSSYRRPFVIALVLGLVSSAFSALLMFTSGYLISATAQEGITLFAIMLPIAFVQVFGIGKPLARYLERLVSHSWVLRVTSDLRRMLYNHVAVSASDPTHSRASGEYLSILSDDIAHLQNLYLRVFFPHLIAILLACLATIAFGIFSPAFACAMLLVFFGLVLVLPIATLAATRIRAQRIKAMRSECFQKLSDDIAGIDDWKLSGRAQETLATIAMNDNARRDLDRRIRSFDRTMELVSLLVLALVTCSVLAWSGGLFGGDPSTANWIAAFALGLFPLIESFAVLPAIIPTATDHMESINRLGIISGESGNTCKQAQFPESQDGSISIHNLTYSYPNATAPAIDGINFEIEDRQKVAILGRSGSGKSTLVSLVRGMLEPQAGSIKVGNNDMIARTYDVSGTIGYLSQNPYVFNKTLRDNLSLARPDATDEQMLNVLRSVGLEDRFKTLPDGLATFIGETGTGLSGGEAHRIALARTLIADTPIVIVDEPFAALDPATEADLLDTLFKACENRTLIVITHHLAHIDRFDSAVFLENGKIELQGSPAELERTSAHFRDLVSADRNL